jgi:uncharacterized protein (DUF433 family)
MRRKDIAVAIQADMLTVAEAAVLAGVDTRAVNDAIDRHVLPGSLVRTDGGRRVAPEGCVVVSFYKDTEGSLTADLRAEVIRRISGLLVEKAGGSALLTWSARVARLMEKPLSVSGLSGFITVDLDPFVRKVGAAAAELEEASAMVTEDAGVLDGIPCIRDTRIPVHDVAASVRAPIPMADILEAYPDLTEREVRLAEVYARANPPRGRPRRVAEAIPGARETFRGSAPRREGPGLPAASRHRLMS